MMLSLLAKYKYSLHIITKTIKPDVEFSLPTKVTNCLLKPKHYRNP